MSSFVASPTVPRGQAGAGRRGDSRQAPQLPPLHRGRGPDCPGIASQDGLDEARDRAPEPTAPPAPPPEGRAVGDPATSPAGQQGPNHLPAVNGSGATTVHHGTQPSSAPLRRGSDAGQVSAAAGADGAAGELAAAAGSVPIVPI
jgi:hypothetical protein